MSKADDFLVEIGTEELPPKELKNLINSFADSLQKALHSARLEYESVATYAGPRRLAAVVTNLSYTQTNQELIVKGPSISVGYDNKGKITSAGSAFAKSAASSQRFLIA